MAKIQGRLKYRLLHIIGKLRLSSFKRQQYWPQNVTCQNESEILLRTFSTHLISSVQFRASYADKVERTQDDRGQLKIAAFWVLIFRARCHYKAKCTDVSN